MGKILRWASCPMSLGVLTLIFCATRNLLFLIKNKIMNLILLHLILKLISLGLGLAVTVCGTKGILPQTKRRLAPAMGQDAHTNVNYLSSCCCRTSHRFVVLLSFSYRTLWTLYKTYKFFNKTQHLEFL